MEFESTCRSAPRAGSWRVVCRVRAKREESPVYRIVVDNDWQIAADQALRHTALVDVLVAVRDRRATLGNVGEVEDIGQRRGEAIAGSVLALVVKRGVGRRTAGAHESPNTDAFDRWHLRRQ